MRRLLLRLIGMTAAIVAAVLVYAAVTLPPAAVHPPSASTPSPLRVAGAYHIHSARSDGSGDIDAIAAAAARAGLQFIIVTDHGDATRTPDPPAYRHGVLCIDAVEISTGSGHVVALNLRTGTPFALAGAARDVIDDIHRFGGWAVAAHPDSPREELRWQTNGGRTPLGTDGLEWFNADSEWRKPSTGALAAVALRSLLRAPESIASMFGSPKPSLARWDAALTTRDMFALAAVDAHARMGQDSGSGQGGFALAYPGYATMFRTVTQTVSLAQPLSGDAAADADAVLQAIHAGRSYSVVRAFIDAPAALQFSASAGSDRVDFGGALPAPGAPVTFVASVPAGTGARVALIKGGEDLALGMDNVEYTTSDPGAYRVEARLDGRPVPWIVSNAIRVGTPGPPGGFQGPVGSPTPLSCDGTPTPLDPRSWVIEKHPTSTAEIAVDRTDVRLRYQLGPGAPAGQYVAIASNGSGEAAVACIAFTASSPRPMRMSVQIRLPGDQRWQKSVYVGPEPALVIVPLRDLDPVGRRTMRPVTAKVQSILIVIDTVNTLPGTGGEVLLKDLGYIPAR